MSIWWWLSVGFDTLAVLSGLVGVLALWYWRRWEAALPWVLAGLMWTVLALGSLFLAGWRW